MGGILYFLLRFKLGDILPDRQNDHVRFLSARFHILRFSGRCDRFISSRVRWGTDVGHCPLFCGGLVLPFLYGIFRNSTRVCLVLRRHQNTRPNEGKPVHQFCSHQRNHTRLFHSRRTHYPVFICGSDLCQFRSISDKHSIHKKNLPCFQRCLSVLTVGGWSEA